ncbi:MAG: bacteriocin transport accessory protein [Lachnospiraceae bacterium]|nr:bacteriocin transport accessory protein [Lachnospiraceae bacterium]
MKKLLTLIMIFCVTLSMTACTEKEADKTNGSESPLALLNTVWDSYDEDERFAAAGGDFSEENSNMEGPGTYSIEDAAALDAALGFPAAAIDKIDSAASLMHMMNGNNFTCGIYHVMDAADMADVTSALESNIQSRQWMCGFPEKLLIMTVGEYVVGAFGSEELLGTFQSKLTAAYPNAETVCYDPIS